MNKNGNSLPPCKIIRESSSLSRVLYEDVLKIDLRDSAGLRQAWHEISLNSGRRIQLKKNAHR